MTREEEYNNLSIRMGELNKQENELAEELRKVRKEQCLLLEKYHLIRDKGIKYENNKHN